MTTDWIVFDYGCVLSLPQPAADWATLVAGSGMEAAEFAAGYWKHRVPYDRGDVDAIQYWSAVLDRRADAETAAELDRLDLASWQHRNMGTFTIVEELADSGARLALLSNTPEPLARAMATASWAPLFTRHFYSCRIREVKPNPAIFQYVLSELGSPPERVTFIDDRLENVDGAAALGIRALHFTTAEALATQL
jgi:putative hydrolase of the HAD superfamily